MNWNTNTNTNMKNKNIYWIRHGESYSNTSDLNSNIIDPGLTPKGFAQCVELKNKIKSLNLDQQIDLIVVSPMARTLETCMSVFDDLIYKVNFTSMDEIREQINKPCHQRKHITQILSNPLYKFIDFSNILYDNDFLYIETMGSESKYQVLSRCEKFLSWLSKRTEMNIIVITHGNFLYPMFNEVMPKYNIFPISNSFFLNCEMRLTIMN